MGDDVERCALCGRQDTDERWLWLTASRYDQEVDCEFEEVELAFCRREHAGEFLMTRELEFPPVTAAERGSGTRVDHFFFGCGLLAIILGLIGLVTLVRWLV